MPVSFSDGAMTTFNEAVAVFLVDARMEGRAAWTLQKHRQELRRYGAWLEAEGLDWQAVDAAAVKRYARTRAHLSASARGATFCTLRVFFRWAVANGYVATSPAAGLATPARPKPQPRALTRAHVRQLLAYVGSQEGLRARRDATLILTALYTGLRAAELARLRWSDIDLDASLITVWISKWHHGRVIPVHPQLLDILAAWQREQALGASAPVFADTHVGQACGQSITPARVGKIVKRIATATGLPLTTHVLRHTFATWTLRRSHDLYAVSKALGHQGLKQTEIYLSADTEQIAAAVRQLPNPEEW